MTQGNGLRVLVAAEDGLPRLVEEALLTFLPTASVTRIEMESLKRHRLPPAMCAIIGPRFGDLPQIDAARAFRAAAFDGAIVLIADEPPASDVVTAARQLGVTDFVAMETLASRLADAVLHAASAPEDSVALCELRETQRLIAAGDVALKLQHALNNPLAAMMAEAQLLELEPLGEEHLQAVRRMVELCRRLAGIVRRLEVIVPPKIEALAGNERERARTSQT